MQVNSGYTKFKCYNDYYCFGYKETSTIWVEDAEVSEELKKLLKYRAVLLKNFIAKYKSVNESYTFMEEFYLSDKKEIEKIEEEIATDYPEEVEHLKEYHFIRKQVPFEISEEEKYICISCGNVASKEEMHGNFDFCNQCHQSGTIRCQNVYCVEANHLSEYKEQLLEQKRWEEARNVCWNIIGVLEKIDPFYEDLISEAACEIACNLVTIIKISNETEQYLDTDKLCNRALEFYRKSRYLGYAGVEPFWVEECLFLSLSAKLNDPNAIKLSTADIKGILKEMEKEADWSKEIYESEFQEHFKNNCKKCDDFLIAGHAFALQLLQQQNVSVAEIDSIKKKIEEIIKSSKFHTEKEKMEHLSNLSIIENNNTDNIYKKNSFQNKGCYVATAVYGSYDCPEVWVLRRFRDGFLEKFSLGRSFIKWYYKVSPRLIIKHKNNRTIVRIVKSILDCLVKLLVHMKVSQKKYYD